MTTEKRLPPHIHQKLDTLIFDLDGVITSERKYWNTARLTVWELIESDDYLSLKNYFGAGKHFSGEILQAGEKVIPSSLIYELKNRAINSNWDITYLVASLRLVGILDQSTGAFHHAKRVAAIFNSNAVAEEKLHSVGRLLAESEADLRSGNAMLRQFFSEIDTLTGTALLDHLPFFVQNKLGIESSFFAHKRDLWQLCYQNFQDWYEGKKTSTYTNAQQRLPLLPSEQNNASSTRRPVFPYSAAPEKKTVINPARIGAVLKKLRDSGRYTLGIATGRPKIEAIEPLKAVGLLQYFEKGQIVTYDEVIEAETILAQSGEIARLGKPHPFVLLKAIYPDEAVKTLCSVEFWHKDHSNAAFIGDSTSDVKAAQKAGCVAIGVLTGLGKGKTAREIKRQTLENLGCDIILNNILDLPRALGIEALPSSNERQIAKQSKLESMFHHRVQ